MGAPGRFDPPPLPEVNVHAAAQRRSRLIRFGLFATAMVAAESIVAGFIPSSPAPGVLAGAILFDLLLVVPAAYWWVFLRGRAPALRAAPVLGAAMAAAWLILPASQRHLVADLRMLAIPLEVAASALLVRAAVRAARAGSGEGFMERVEAAAAQVLPSKLAATAVAGELGVIAYALFSWRWKPEVPAGHTPFTSHVRSGYAGIAFALIVASVVEGVAVHLLVAPWSPFVAWTLTALTVYGMLWIVGDLRALQLRPTLVGPDGLHVRTGLRWTVRIPWSDVMSVEEVRRGSDVPGCLRTTPIGPPALVLGLRTPATLQGPFGIVRRGDRIGLGADDPRGLRAAIASHLNLDAR